MTSGRGVELESSHGRAARSPGTLSTQPCVAPAAAYVPCSGTPVSLSTSSMIQIKSPLQSPADARLSLPLASSRVWCAGKRRGEGDRAQRRARLCPRLTMQPLGHAALQARGVSAPIQAPFCRETGRTPGGLRAQQDACAPRCHPASRQRSPGRPACPPGWTRGVGRAAACSPCRAHQQKSDGRATRKGLSRAFSEIAGGGPLIGRASLPFQRRHATALHLHLTL